MAAQRTEPRSGSSSEKPKGSRRRRRQERKRAREIRRTILACAFILLQVTGFGLANFAKRGTWGEASGFLLLQPMQILLNLLDSRFQLTRGLRDADAVLLVTLLSLPLNVFFWYVVWRGWRKLRRVQRRRRHAPGSSHGMAQPSPRTMLSPRTDAAPRAAGSVPSATAFAASPEPKSSAADAVLRE